MEFGLRGVRQLHLTSKWIENKSPLIHQTSSPLLQLVFNACFYWIAALSNLCHCFAFHFTTIFSRKFPSVFSTHCTSIQSIMNWWSFSPATHTFGSTSAPAPSPAPAPVRPFTCYVHYSNVMAVRVLSHAKPAGQFKLTECCPVQSNPLFSNVWLIQTAWLGLAQRLHQ